MTTDSPSEPDRPRRAQLGIRTRIVVGYVALLAAALAISVVLIRQVQLARLDREIDRDLAHEVDELRLVAGDIDPATGEPFGADVATIFDAFLSRSVPDRNEAFYSLVDGRPFLVSFDAPTELLDDPAIVGDWATATEPRVATISTPVGQARALAVPLIADDATVGTFVAVHFLGPERDEISQNLRVIVLACGVVLVASAFLAWSLAGRVLRPVRELTRTARSISGTDLSARIPVTGDDELAELGRTFNDMLDRLTDGFDQQRRFLDDVAHELRTPITIAQGHLDLLDGDPAEREETIAIVTDELERMGRYVSDLLVLAKAERPDFLRPAPVDLGEFARTTLRTLTGLADRRWVLDSAPDDDTEFLTADAGRLSQAVLNLATNAVQHTSEGDEIGLAVSVDRSRGVARLAIRDTGEGVDASVAAKLFERHARGATSRTTRPDGMGIGLTIVDAIARAHGGQVDVRSTPGAGATFEIAIPIGAPLPPPLAPSPPPPSPPAREEEPTA